MWGLAFAAIRHNRGGFAGVFVAVFFAAALITGLGVLLESGFRGGVAPQRYLAAEVVVGGQQALPVPGDVAQPFTERVMLPADAVGKVGAVAGVRQAVGDITVPMTTETHTPVEVHGWSSAALTPYSLTAGALPARDGEVVVDGSFGVAPGAEVRLSYGGVPSAYKVVGVASSGGSRVATAFLSDQAATALWSHPDRVGAVGVLPQPGTDPATLAAAISRAVPGVEVYTGADRGEVESLDSFGARTQLMALSASFAGVALLIAVFVVASTLSLSVGQRRREFALLRAVGTLPRQIHGMIGREVRVVAGLAALLGVAPGYLLAGVLGSQFSGAGVMPADFALAYSPLPGLAAVVLSVATAAGAAAVAARRPARIDPIDAIRESGVETPKLGKGRVVTGVVLAGIGLVASLAPLLLPGLVGLTAVGAAALLLIIAVGLVGPRLVELFLGLLGPLLRVGTSPAGVLAEASIRGYTRRLSAAVVPLALAITFGSVQLFMPTTIAAEAATQSRDGITADYLVAAPGSGLSQDLAAKVAAVPGVTAADPVIRSSAVVTTPMFEDEVLVEQYALQGVDPKSRTLDLRVQEGSLERLSEPDTVALSTTVASSMDAKVGKEVTFHLGDGTELTATVVAVYGRGLGFGDLTLSAEALRPHTTTGLADYLLVSSTPDARAGVEQLGLAVQDTSVPAGSGERDTQSWVNLIALLVILGYVALSVVNTLVMATVGRRREFTLLRLIGTTDRQIRRMTLIESLVAVVIAVVVGTVTAIPPLVGFALGVSGQPVPTISPLAYLVIVGATAVLGVVSIRVPTRTALRVPLAP
ncbi:ABC transporter permease [Umezawaea tangerina]|uniref:Putative ABC transport system permease protein n=1 Tax=Umezawaea tangerina TaxID=84725 RepID=A0A2T0TGN8_9PSEU|nr:ABC transporter permease [Umezawaea tangerina]PRY44840.1 putative ABC transport system permease protein [Umezawaea tangerina]